MRLSLRKWYLDVVTDDGRLAIAYQGEIRRGRLRHAVAGVLVREPGDDRAAWRFTLRDAPPPQVHEHALHWESDRLGLVVQAESLEPPVAERLLETPDGVMDWQAVMPRARVRVRAGDVTLSGLGYVECLEIAGIAPWDIPADEVRWGRFLCASGSVVWIDWRGTGARRFVFRDGQPAEALELSDDGITFADGARLRLCDPGIVAAETLGHLLRPLAPLRALVRPLAGTHQTRWLSRGDYRGAGAAHRSGWAMHERLRFA